MGVLNNRRALVVRDGRVREYHIAAVRFTVAVGGGDNWGRGLSDTHRRADHGHRGLRLLLRVTDRGRIGRGRAERYREPERVSARRRCRVRRRGRERLGASEDPRLTDRERVTVAPGRCNERGNVVPQVVAGLVLRVAIPL